MPEILLFNKPFNVLCQFTDEPQYRDQRQTLADFLDLPGFYAAGRLDRDSEGLLVLTNDGQVQQRITNPLGKLAKTYLVQVEGDIDPSALKKLASGVLLKDGRTLPAKVQKVREPDWLWPRNPPIRERAQIPTSWIKLTITEGKNRQVRRMTAAVGFPTLRLIRWQIGPWKIDHLAPGEHVLIHYTENELDQWLPALKSKLTAPKNQKSLQKSPQNRRQTNRQKNRSKPEAFSNNRDPSSARNAKHQGSDFSPAGKKPKSRLNANKKR